MMTMPVGEISKWQRSAHEVSALLKAVGNERRLLILCQLSAYGEMSVGQLLETVDLSQSALSQHLAKMRTADIVRARRDGQTIYYSIGDTRIADLMATLYRLYCHEGT